MKFQYLTQFVNENTHLFNKGAQFQSVKSYCLVSGTDSQKQSQNQSIPPLWVVELVFFPPLFDSLQGSLIVALKAPSTLGFYSVLKELTDGTSALNLKKDPRFKARKSPVESYLKAHFLNQRVFSISALQEAIEFNFSPEESPPSRIRFSEGLNQTLWVECPDVLPKPFRNRLVLAPLAETPVATEIQKGSEGSPSVESPIPSKEAKILGSSKRWQKLLKNIEDDVLESQKALELWRPLMAELKRNPDFLFQFDSWSESFQKVYLEFSTNSKPSPQKKHERRDILDRLYAHVKKLEKQNSGATARLLHLKKLGESRYFESRTIAPLAPLAEKSETPSQAPPDRPQKKPGLWVFLEELQLWARVGRTASENAELFRQAGARDLWFHIKGFPGAHIWIPRGQKMFGAKALATEKIIESGCRLALLNSRTKTGSRESGEVEFTERHNLKALKGKEAQGTLLVQRSKTKYISAKKPLKE